MPDSDQSPVSPRRLWWGRGLFSFAALWSVALLVAFYQKAPLHLHGTWPWYARAPRWVEDMQGGWLGMPWAVVGQGALFLLAAAGLIVGGGWVWGRISPGSSVVGRMVWGGGLLAGALGTAVFFVSVVGWIGWGAWGLWGAAAALGVWGAFRWVREGIFGWGWARRLGWGDWVVLGVLVAVHGLTLLYALTPSVQSDALRYHLAGPQEWLKAGRLVYLPYNAFTCFPANVDMLFLLGLGIGGDLLAKAFHFLYLPLCAGAVGLMAREAMGGAGARLGGVRVDLLAAAGFALSPLAVPLAGWAFIDLGVTFYTLGAAYFLMRWARERRTRDWVLSAAFAGLLCASKATGVIVAVWGGACLVVFSAMLESGAFGRRFVVGVRRAFLYGVIAAAIVAPWWVKNAVQVGNPVYPLAPSVFGGGEWTAENEAFLKAKGGEKGDRSPASIPLLPWRTALEPGHFGNFTLGPLFLVMFPWGVGWALAALALTRKRRAWAMLAAWLFFLLGFWFVTYQSNRFLLPACGVGLAAILGGVRAAWGRVRWVAAIGVGAFLLCVAYNTADSVRWLLFEEGRFDRREMRTGSRWPAVALGFVARDDYLRSLVNYYDCAAYCNRTVGDGGKVFLLGEHRKMHWRCAVAGSDWFDVPMIRGYLRQASDADGVLDALLADGFTDMFLNLAEWGWPGEAETVPGSAWWYKRRFFSERDLLILRDLIASTRLRPVHATVPGRITVAHILPR